MYDLSEIFIIPIVITYNIGKYTIFILFIDGTFTIKFVINNNTNVAVINPLKLNFFVFMLNTKSDIPSIIPIIRNGTSTKNRLYLFRKTDWIPVNPHSKIFEKLISPTL